LLHHPGDDSQGKREEADATADVISAESVAVVVERVVAGMI
jgi:hypothetical protein